MHIRKHILDIIHLRDMGLKERARGHGASES